LQLIAVVDDDAHVRHAIARLLRSAGYAVAEYFCGADFLASLTERRALCLVLDLHMSALSGFKVLEALTRGAYDIPVILVTADPTVKNIARATRLGAVSCLPKPVDAVRLLEAVRKACARVGGGRTCRE
jgi:FixJ family two-component response regulator